MKKIVVIFALMATMILSVLPAQAGGFWGLTFSAGSEKDPFYGRIGFFDTVTGKEIDCSAGYIRASKGQQITVVVLPEGATRSKDWLVGFSQFALLNEEAVDYADFDLSTGWTYTFTAKDGITPFSVALTKKGAKKHFFRVIFKITYRKSDLTSVANFFITTCSDMENGNSYNGRNQEGLSWEKLNAAFAQQNAFNQKVAASVNSLDSRVSNLESWVMQATAGTARPNPVSISKVRYSFRIVDRNGRPFNGNYTIWIFDSEGEHSYPRSNCSVFRMKDARPGNYKVCLSSNGMPKSSWIDFDASDGAEYQLAVSR